MAKRKFEMYEYRQIIVRLRLGESIRGIVLSKLACRKKVREVRKIALTQGWLNKQSSIPSDDVLAQLFKSSSVTPSTPSSVLLYQKQITDWCQQGIQASTIHSALQREHGFSGSYNAVQRFAKKIRDKLTTTITTILDFKPGECVQVDFGAGPKFINEETGEIIST